MFTRLPESDARRQRRLGGFTVSTVVHATLIALAVRATAWSSSAPAPVPEPNPPVYIEAHDPTPPRNPAPVTQRSTGPAGPVSPPPEVPPIGPIDIVAGIPPVGTLADPSVGAEFRNPVDGVAGPPSGPVAPNVGDGPRTERTVDRPIVALPGTRPPRYPTLLRQAGIEGDVLVQFVVDTLGRVEPGSIRVLEQAHALFEDAVRDALGRTRFQPAEANGRKVRQLAEQTFTFRIR